MRRLLPILLMIALAACTLTSAPENNEEDLPTATTEAQDVQPSNTPEPLVTSTLPPTSLPLPNNPQQPPTSVSSGSTGQTSTTPVPAQTSFSPIAEGERSFALQAGGASIRGAGINLLPVEIYHFSQNPANANRFAVVDQPGMLYITDRNGQNAFRIEQGPYTQFPALSRDENNAAAILSQWSPDGQYLAFIVAGRKQAADGMWYFAPGQFAPLQLLVDCPFEGFIGCNIVQPSDSIRFWESLDIAWSPDSQSILTTVNLPSEGRQGLIVSGITRNERIRDQRPPIIRYDYGSWGSDGRILASGRNPDGTVTVDWINRDGTLSATVYPASVNGLWMGWAVQQPNGDIVALGRPAASQGAVGIYNMNGVALTELIGSAFPQRVVWSPDRSSVLVSAGGRQFIARTNGQVVDITDESAGLAVNWAE